MQPPLCPLPKYLVTLPRPPESPTRVNQSLLHPRPGPGPGHPLSFCLRPLQKSHTNTAPRPVPPASGFLTQHPVRKVRARCHLSSSRCGWRIFPSHEDPAFPLRVHLSVAPSLPPSFLAVRDNAAVNVRVSVCGGVLSVLLGRYLGVELLGHVEL